MTSSCKFGFTRKVKTERGKCYDVTSLLPTPNASSELGHGVFMHKWYTVLIVQEIKNMQGTLYKFGFTRKVQTERGKCYDVTSLLPNTVQSITKSVKCDVCDEDFNSKQYLDQHVFQKHRTTTGPVLGAESSDKPIDIHARFQNVHKNKENECESSYAIESGCV